MNKDKFLVKDGNRAEWGVPEGYPWKEGVIIEWDGNTEGLDAVDTDDGVEGMFYRVSDVVLSNEQIKVGIIKNSKGVEKSISDDWGTLVNKGAVTDDIVYADVVIFVRKDNASFEGIEFKKAGVYFIRISGGGTYIQKFETKTIQPIAADFLPLATATTAGTMK